MTAPTPPQRNTRPAQNAASERRPGPYTAVRAFLDQHAPALADRAFARIEANEPELGSSYLWTARRHLVRELGEEIVDSAAWAALTAVRVERDPDLTGSDRERATALLAAVAAASARTDLLVEQLRPLIGAP